MGGERGRGGGEEAVRSFSPSLQGTEGMEVSKNCQRLGSGGLRQGKRLREYSMNKGGGQEIRILTRSLFEKRSGIR